MNRKFYKLMSIIALSFQASISAQYVFPIVDAVEPVYLGGMVDSHRFTISPMAGKAEMKQGDLKEKGWLYGLRANYDILKPNAIYFGGEIGYKFGDLKGNGDASFIKANIVNPENRKENPTIFMVETSSKSRYSDIWLEGRVGYTFSDIYVLSSFISPYFVVGAEHEKDNFASNGSLDVKHEIEYGYMGCGAVSTFLIRPGLSIGANFKFKWMFNSTAKTSRRDHVKDKDLSPANHFHWSVEVPLIFNMSPNTTISAAPFYEYKNYERHKLAESGKEKSKFHMYGAAIQMDYAF